MSFLVDYGVVSREGSLTKRTRCLLRCSTVRERDPIKKDLVVLLPFILILIWQSRCRVRSWTFTIVVEMPIYYTTSLSVLFPSRKIILTMKSSWKTKHGVSSWKNIGWLDGVLAVTLRRITFEKSLEFFPRWLKFHFSFSQSSFLSLLPSLSLFTRQHWISFFLL